NWRGHGRAGPVSWPVSPEPRRSRHVGRRRASAARAAAPVFVDQSGRRRRLVVLVGSALGTVLVAMLGLLLAGLTGTGGVPVPGFPDAGRQADLGETGDAEPEPTVRPEPAPQAPPQPLLTSASAPPSSGSGSPPSSGPGEPSTNRRVPTHTPTHKPRPS